jgi:hypothetical protein
MAADRMTTSTSESSVFLTVALPSFAIASITGQGESSTLAGSSQVDRLRSS